MRIGTTPTHTFILPFNASQIDSVEITYEQDGKAVLTKVKEDCKFAKNTVAVKLTQEDTFKFAGNKNVNIQIRIRSGEDAFSSDIICVRCDRSLSREVL